MEVIEILHPCNILIGLNLIENQLQTTYKSHDTEAVQKETQCHIDEQDGPAPTVSNHKQGQLVSTATNDQTGQPAECPTSQTQRHVPDI